MVDDGDEFITFEKLNLVPYEKDLIIIDLLSRVRTVFKLVLDSAEIYERIIPNKYNNSIKNLYIGSEMRMRGFYRVSHGLAI